MAKKEFKNPFENVKNIFTKKQEVTADGEVVVTEKKKITGTDVKKIAGKVWSGYSFIFVFIAIFIIFIAMAPNTTWNGVMNILRHSSVVGLMAIGMGLVIITGGIDLSVGSNLALTGVVAAMTFNSTNSGFATFIVAVLFGTAAGAVNGILIGKAKMPAFIVTLATMLVYRSLAQYTVRAELGASIIPLDAQLSGYESLFDFGNGFVATIPNTGLILIAVTILFVFIANRTKYGRHVYASGSNEKAAYLSGINVDWIKVSVYTITGALVGLGAFLWLGMNGSVDPPTIGKNNEMYAIAAVVIGGISMAGGKGKIVGVLFGAMTYTVIDKIIAAAGVDALINDTIKGAILLAAVFLQLVGPMLRGVKISDQIKEITGKWLSFGKSKKALTAEDDDDEEGGITYDASDDAVTEAEEAAERAVEDVLDGHASPEDAAEAVKDDSPVDKAEEHTEETPED